MIDFDDILMSSLEEIAESKYSSLFELLHTGIAILSPKGIFLYANTSYMKMFGFSKSIIGKHVSQLFLTSEQGVMEAIRTRKMTICSSVTTDNSKGVSFRCPIINNRDELLGIIVEAVPTNIEKEEFLSLLDTMKGLEERANYIEHQILKKPGMLHTFDSIVGESQVMQKLKKLGKRFAKTDQNVLIFGESGTGKELVAQALHTASGRAAEPFVAVNCAALPHELIESELFGYESGAFTGAKSSGMKGKFELADKGTIFLDEIGDLPMPMQAKLLRVLESGEIQKIGHSGRMHSDFRLVAATNKKLLKLVDEGLFREDLYHRLNILELIVPPLRERTSDIPLLVRHLIEVIVGRKRAKEINISNEVYRLFSEYSWRGNIRELRNVLSFALYDMENAEKLLTGKHLPARFFREISESPHDGGHPSAAAQTLSNASAKAEREALVSALAKANNNKTIAAQLLKISRNKLYKKMRDYDIELK